MDMDNGYMDTWTSNSKLDIKLWIRSGHRLQNVIFGPGMTRAYFGPGTRVPRPGTQDPGPRNWDLERRTRNPGPNRHAGMHERQIGSQQGKSRGKYRKPLKVSNKTVVALYGMIFGSDAWDL